MDVECVMHFSNSVEHVDLKSNAFCVSCRDIVHAAITRLATTSEAP
jgi:predicted Zn-dependent protease